MAKKSSFSESIYGLMLPALFVFAWVMALTSTAPGAVAGEAAQMGYLRWLLYFCGFAFVISTVMHSVFAKMTAKSIGWKTNGFQYEIAFVSLGIGLGCFYAIHHQLEAMAAISLPIITFLGLAGLNHLKEVLKDNNYAPNNLFILVWDFGIPISLGILLLQLLK